MCAGLVAVTGAFADPRLEHIGTFVWDRPESYFGGWSGIEVAEGGATFVAIGDNSQHYDGQFERSDGQITGIVRVPVGALVETDGVRIHMKGDATLGDSEGLVALPGGGFAVSFERQHRILLYPDGGAPTAIALPREIFSVGQNGGVEALAVDAMGRFIAIPESRPSGMAGFPVWRQRDAGWEQVLLLPHTQGFVPVGADVAPDGRLFVLERAFRGIGFQSRVRIVDLDADPANSAVIWSSRLRTFDNLEGLSVWQDEAGLRLTMISDDNYNRFQRTEIVEFRLTE